MDENDIRINDNKNNDNGKVPFEKKYLIGVTIVAVVLVIVMTIVGIYIGYSVANKKVSTSIVETNPIIKIEGSSLGVGVQDVTKVVEDSVVQITAESRSPYGVMVSRGSGVIISNDGYIVTNAHVINNAESEKDITITLANGNEYVAMDYRLDDYTDIAYIKIDTSEKLTQAVLGNSDKLSKGEQVVVIGNPLGTLGGSVTDGILSALDRDIIVDNRPMRLLQTNAEINPGNSGGGMFNMKGELIGIVNAKSTATEVEGIGFAIPINLAKTVLYDLHKVGYVQGRIDTGILPVNIANRRDMITAFGGIVGDGEVPAVYVYGVDRRLESKVKVADKIVAINNKVVNDVGEYNSILGNYAIGDIITLTLKRNGQLIEEQITLQEYKGTLSIR